MAKEKYFPFRSVSGDRKYSAEDWAAYFAQFIGNGVFYSSTDKMKVAEYDRMKVKVQKGAGFIAGRMYLLEEDTIITLDTADGVLNRIDRIVLRCDYANRLMTVTVKKGGYSTNPTAPNLTRDEDVYELALADVYVAAGTVTITAADITDQRFNTSLCGIVTGLVEQADTEEIFSQFQAAFEEWFEYVKAVLDEDAAGNLLAQINTKASNSDLQAEVTARKAEVAVERARINALTKMEEGSTTGDAELQDIRVGADGVTYETAGEAVRKQVSNLSSEIEELYNAMNGNYNDVNLLKYDWVVGYAYNVDYPNGIGADERYFTSVNVLKAEKDFVIYNPNTSLYFMVLARYGSTDNSSYISADFSNPAKYELSKGDCYRLCIKFVDNSPMTVEAMNDFLSNATGEKWAFLGDSITEGVNTTKTYHAYISDKIGITNLNYGANGSCISTYILPESSHSYCICRRVETVDKKVNKLFIFGGTNDFNRGCPMGEFFTVAEDGTRTFSNDTNTFKGALSVLFQYVKNNFVDSDVIILTPIHRGNFDSQPTDLEKNVGGLYLDDYVNAIKDASALFGIGKVIDLYTISGLNPNFTPDATKYFHVGTDELHPNEVGHEKIADCILNNL